MKTVLALGLAGGLAASLLLAGAADARGQHAPRHGSGGSKAGADAAMGLKPIDPFGKSGGLDGGLGGKHAKRDPMAMGGGAMGGGSSLTFGSSLGGGKTPGGGKHKRGGGLGEFGG